MMFGFAGAIICATVLTALPGWAHTPEIRGAPLAGLVALWLAGRVAFLGVAWLPPAVVLVADGALYVVLLALLAAQLRRVANRYYLLLLPVFAGMLAGDVLFLAGRAETGLMASLYSIVLLYALKGGVFVPVFTGNHLRATGRGDQAPFLLPLEVAAVVAVVALAAADLAGAPPRWRAAAALLAFAVHAVRLAALAGLEGARHAAVVDDARRVRLDGARVPAARARRPGRAKAPARAWLHAFTVGALGSMMLGLMTRVALRHTGRPLVLPPAIVAAYLLIQAAALAARRRRDGRRRRCSRSRLPVPHGSPRSRSTLPASARCCVSPSLPRVAVSPLTADAQPLRRDGAR